MIDNWLDGKLDVFGGTKAFCISMLKDLGWYKTETALEERIRLITERQGQGPWMDRSGGNYTARKRGSEYLFKSD